MQTTTSGGSLKVAVLLATYNAGNFIQPQIASLKDNKTHFSLHWIDDHSSDNTHENVVRVAKQNSLSLTEWKNAQRLGVPGTFFYLLECVDADLYLFCDQDDIWERGKIDATVKSLCEDVESVVLSCSDPLLFSDSRPHLLYRVSELTGATASIALQDSRLFMAGIAYGHTQGFTRPLRDLFLRHKEIARSYAYMHDEWMHNIAIASGSVRLLKDVPTTRYRWHESNASGALSGWRLPAHGRGYITMSRTQRAEYRRVLARQAQGFLLASTTLPSGPKLSYACEVARMVSTLDRRQSIPGLIRSLRRRIWFPGKRLALALLVSCLWSDAVA